MTDLKSLKFEKKLIISRLLVNIFFATSFYGLMRKYIVDSMLFATIIK